MSSALEDVVVLEMTTSFWAGAGTGLLADFGARVIRMDDPRSPANRTSDDPVADASLHELANRNKESIALDLSNEHGRAAFENLVRKSDVFVTDSEASTLKEERLDYASLAAVKRDIIYARGSGFGPRGLDADGPALDELAAARTGMMPILPQPGQPPVYSGAGQMNSSVMLALGVMLALLHRAETGEGQEVDVSLLGGNMYGASLDLQAFLAMGGERFLQPVSRLDAGNPMSGTLYPTSDGLWVTLTMPDTDRWWPGLAEITGLDLADKRFDSHEKRCEENRLLLIELLEQAFRQQPAEHWRREFNERQLSADVIEEYSYPANDELARINRFVIEDNGAKSLGFPLYMSESEATVRSREPKSGEHSASVLRELLGYDTNEIFNWSRQTLSPDAAPDSDNTEALTALHQIVQELRDQPIWEVAAHESLGSDFTLQIGRRIELPPRSSRKGRKFSTDEGEYVLYVKCAWRMEEQGKISVSWQDDLSDGGPVMSALQALEGRRIESADVGPRGWDLALELDNGMRLAVLCDESVGSEYDTCWYLRGPASGVAVLSGGGLRLEPRSPRGSG